MSCHLRDLLLEMAQTISVGETRGAGPGDMPIAALRFYNLKIRYKRRRVQWAGPSGEGKIKLPKSKIQPAIRSLFSNDAGRVLIAGFQYVSWDKTAEEIKEEAKRKTVLVDQEKPAPEETTHRLTQQGLRDEPDLAWKLLDDSMTVRICLSEAGRRLTQLIYGKHLAKQD